MAFHAPIAYLLVFVMSTILYLRGLKIINKMALIWEPGMYMLLEEENIFFLLYSYVTNWLQM